jgi:hypothetical protein
VEEAVSEPVDDLLVRLREFPELAALVVNPDEWTIRGIGIYAGEFWYSYHITRTNPYTDVEYKFALHVHGASHGYPVERVVVTNSSNSIEKHWICDWYGTNDYKTYIERAYLAWTGLCVTP